MGKLVFDESGNAVSAKARAVASRYGQNQVNGRDETSRRGFISGNDRGGDTHGRFRRGSRGATDSENGERGHWKGDDCRPQKREWNDTKPEYCDYDREKLQALKEEEEHEHKTFPKKKNLKWENAKLRYWRIIIRNLPFQTTKEDLIKTCALHGEFTEVVLPKCKDPRFPKSCAGYGFVQYKEKEIAERAIKQLNESQIHGRQVAADWTMPKDTYETAKHEEEEMLKKKVKFENDEIAEKEMEVDKDEENEEEHEEDRMEVSDSDDEEEDEEEEEELDDRVKGNGNKLQQREDKAVLEGRAVFLRNLAFITSDESLRKAMTSFGEVKLAIICKFADSGHSKGTGFVHFQNNEASNAVVQAANRGELSIDNRDVSAVIAIPRSDAAKMDKDKHSKTSKDRRNLMLLRVGIIREGTSAAEGMSKEDAAKRAKLVNLARNKLQNLHMFVSPVRLAFHNIPFSLSDTKLREICHEAAGSDSTVAECRIMRDFDNQDNSGEYRSRGFGFVAFTTHEHALKCLHTLNNNPNTFTNERRPIVEFSIEDLKALQIKEARKARSQGKSIAKGKKGSEAIHTDELVNKQVERTIASLRKSGAKPIPLKMGVKNRKRNEPGAPQKVKKDKNKTKKKKVNGKDEKKGSGAPKRTGKAAKRTLSKYLAST